MLYSEFPSPEKPRLVAQAPALGLWAYAIGTLKGVEYCIVVGRKLTARIKPPKDIRVQPTATLFKMAPMDWEAV